MLPLDSVSSREDVLLLDFTESITSGNLPGGNFGREIATPGRFGQRRYSMRIKSDMPVFVEGDLEQSSGKSWKFSPRGYGYAAFSTLPDMASLARAYRASELAALKGAQVLAIQLDKQRALNADQALRAAWQWVGKNIRYEDVGLRYANSNSPIHLRSILESRTTDCKGYALVLQALLENDGITSQSVLVQSDRSKSIQKSKLPHNDFDHVIVYIPVLDRYVDPTIAAGFSLPTGGRRSYGYSLNTATGTLGPISSDRAW